jgi:hypothetical protein
LESVGGAAGEKQVPCGNGRKKSKSNSKCNSRFPAGMEDKKSKSNSKCNSRFPAGMEDKKSNNVRQRMRR